MLESRPSLLRNDRNVEAVTLFRIARRWSPSPTSSATMGHVVT